LKTGGETLQIEENEAPIHATMADSGWRLKMTVSSDAHSHRRRVAARAASPVAGSGQFWSQSARNQISYFLGIFP